MQPVATVSVWVERSLASFALTSVSGHSQAVDIKVNEQPAGNVFRGVCGTATARNSPDIIETTHRATADQNCMKVSHSNNLVEVKVGYQAVVLTRSRLYGPLNLSARDVFLALAKWVPNPNKPTELIANPYSLGTRSIPRFLMTKSASTDPSRTQRQANSPRNCCSMPGATDFQRSAPYASAMQPR